MQILKFFHWQTLKWQFNFKVKLSSSKLTIKVKVIGILIYLSLYNNKGVKLRFYLIILFTFVTTMIYSADEYNYPIKNPYKATIIGSNALTVKETSEKVPSKIYTLKIKPFKKPPESLWYEDSFKFSASIQKEEAPLIFVIAGTGSDYKSKKMKDFEKIFYKAGYSVILISSPLNQNFLVTAGTSKVPGVPMDDSKDLYKVMKTAYNKIKDKAKVSDFYVTGYSLGATESAYVSYIDETEQFFNFKRVLLINPAVNLYTSAKILDDMLDNNIPGGRNNIGKFIDQIIQDMAEELGRDAKLSEDSISTLFKDDVFTDKELSTLIGVSFRFTAIDINYISDLLTKSGVYTDKDPNKFQDLEPIFEKIDGASFTDYINRIGYPFYKAKDKTLTFDKLVDRTDMKTIENYLINNKKIAMVTNKDEIILSKSDKKFLADTFQNKSIIYPYGGHCGNMFYKENVENMLRFFDQGVLKNEN